MSGLISAQTTIFEKTTEHFQKVSHVQNPENSELISNYIISEIARSIPKSSEVTSFSVEFLSMIRLKQLDSTTYSVFGELKEMKFSGDMLYRNIHISEILKPDFADFRVIIMDALNPEVIVFEKNFHNVKLSDNLGYFTILQTEFIDSRANKQYAASFEDLKLVWGEPVRERFMKMSTLINEYFNADQTLDKLNFSLQSINITQLERVAFNNIVLKDVEKELNTLNKFNFPTELNLFYSDPIGFIQRLEKLQLEAGQLRFHINKHLEQLDQLFFEKGMQKIEAEKFDSARYYFRKATEYNLVFVPALLELAYLDYQIGHLDSAASRLHFIHEYTLVSPEYQYRLQEVSRMIINAIEESVQKRIKLENYVEAEYLLNYAIKICNQFIQADCSETMEKLMAQIKFGLYRSFLIVIDKAIEHKRLEIASLYINHALNYQKDNSDYIITPAEAEQYRDRLFNATIIEVEQLNAQKQFVKALELVNRIEQMCDTVPTLNRARIIEPKTRTLRSLYNERLEIIEQEILKGNFIAAETRMKLLTDFINTYPEIEIDFSYTKAEQDIQTHYYHSAISEALTNMQYEFYDVAISHFQNAYEVQEQFNLKKYPKIDSLYRIAAKPVLLSQYNKLIFESSQLPADELLKLQAMYSEMSMKAGLSHSDTILILQQRLSNIVRLIVCDQLHEKIQLKREEAENLILMHNFKEAMVQLEEAADLSKSNATCQFSAEEIIELQNKLLTGIEWQNNMEKLIGILNREQWEEAISLYQTIDRLSSTQSLFMWGVERTELSEFITHQKNTDFLLVGFEHFYEKKQYDDAFKMLENLKSLKFPAETTHEQQIKLGNKLAVRDKIANPGANFKINILKYTEGDEYFLYFSKSYRKTWRKN